MKRKTFIILMIILGILVATGALLMRLKTPKQPTVAMGSPLLDALPANEVVSIKFDGAGLPVTLTRKGNQWVVEERFEYPADFERITDFVRNLKDAKVGRMFGASEEALKRLSLKSPDLKGVPDEDKAMRVRMYDAQGGVVLDLSVGNTRTRGEEKLPDGQFVRLGEDSQVYLIDQTLTAYLTGPAEWVAKTPVNVEADDVREIRCMSPEGETLRFAFARPGKGKPFERVYPENNRKIKRSSLNRLTNALSSINISDVTDPSATPQAVKPGVSPCLIYRLFNGMIYRVYPGNECPKPGVCYVRFEVDYHSPPRSREDETGKAEEKTGQKPEPEQMEKKAREANDRLSPWVFVIPKWQHKAFITRMDELMEGQEGKGKG